MHVFHRGLRNSYGLVLCLVSLLRGVEPLLEGICQAKWSWGFLLATGRRENWSSCIENWSIQRSSYVPARLLYGFVHLLSLLIDAILCSIFINTWPSRCAGYCPSSFQIDSLIPLGFVFAFAECMFYVLLVVHPLYYRCQIHTAWADYRRSLLKVDGFHGSLHPERCHCYARAVYLLSRKSTAPRPRLGSWRSVLRSHNVYKGMGGNLLSLPDGCSNEIPITLTVCWHDLRLLCTQLWGELNRVLVRAQLPRAFEWKVEVVLQEVVVKLGLIFERIVLLIH